MGIPALSDNAVQVGGLATTIVALLPADFALTDDESVKVVILADRLHCPMETAKRALIFFLLFVGAYRHEIAVAQLPDILAQFRIKWGYRKKRHDILHLMQELDFILVMRDYWAKVRAKKYALATGGQQLLNRVLASVFKTETPVAAAAQPAIKTPLPAAS